MIWLDLTRRRTYLDRRIHLKTKDHAQIKTYTTTLDKYLFDIMQIRTTVSCSARHANQQRYNEMCWMKMQFRSIFCIVMYAMYDQRRYDTVIRLLLLAVVICPYTVIPLQSFFMIFTTNWNDCLQNSMTTIFK